MRGQDIIGQASGCLLHLRPFLTRSRRQVIVNTKDFSALALPAPLLANLPSLGYREMTPIQAAALPVALAGRDLIAQAATGSGKTAAFGLPLLSRINPRWFAVQALVLCPTRELAEQVAREIRRLARAVENIKVVTLTGGTRMGPQIGSLEHGAHIVVGTPGRLHDHLWRRTLDLSTVSTLVLAEADRMVDMGFYEEITGIVDACGKRRQTLMFSATYPEDIQRLAKRFMREPERVSVDAKPDAAKIEQRFYKVDPAGRIDALVRLIGHFRPASTLVFCNTREAVKASVRALEAQGIGALALYGDLEQRDRDETLLKFAAGCAPVLVATDVAARGLDIRSLDCVINAEIAPKADVHVHRIGRTGRAGETGLALSLVAPTDTARLARIEEVQGARARWDELAKLTVQPADAKPAPALLCINAGKRDKLRPGDILGALTGEGGLPGTAIGKIQLSDTASYVAIAPDYAKQALAWLDGGRIKTRSVKARIL